MNILKNLFLLLSFCAIFSCSPEEISRDNTDLDEVVNDEMETDPTDSENETEDPTSEDSENETNEEETTDEVVDDTNEETEEEVEPIEEETNNYNLDPNAAPSSNFDLSYWNLNVPIEEADGTSTDITTTELLDEYEHESYFYTGSDGAMVFKSFIDGPKTSTGTSYTRTELREMIYGTRYDDENGLSTKDPQNNWFFSSSDQAVLDTAGAVGGELTATVAVNHVTTTGSNTSQIGRVIIGQIHASDDEPCRLYYRKLPNNSKGSIYFAHEPADGFGAEQWHQMIGSSSSSASNPEDGIALNEKFSYSIKVVDEILTVTITREGKDDVVKSVDMSTSGFANDYMYFKAGAYTQNNTGDATDYDEVSFYKLNITH